MVFLTANLFVRSKGPDEFWRKRKIFKLAAHFKGGRRNVYSQAIRSVHRALQYCCKSRKQKKEDYRELAEVRINSAAMEHGLQFNTFYKSLMRCNVLLNRKSLCDLAIWEPRTFKSLASIALARAKQDGVKVVRDVKTSTNIITKGLIE